MDDQDASAGVHPLSFQDRLRESLNKIVEAIAMGMCYAAGWSFLGGLLVLGYQIFIWLKEGSWPDVAVIDALYEFLPATFISWVLNPHDWIGLAKVIQTVLLWPLSVVLIFFLPLPLLYGGIKVGSIELKTTAKEEGSGYELLRKIEGSEERE